MIKVVLKNEELKNLQEKIALMRVNMETIKVRYEKMKNGPDRFRLWAKERDILIDVLGLESRLRYLK